MLTIAPDETLRVASSDRWCKPDESEIEMVIVMVFGRRRITKEAEH